MAEPLTKEIVTKVAHLARLKLTDAESELFTTQLGQVLGYVELLNELDTSTVEPMAHVADIANVFRDDEIRPSLPRAAALSNAPKTDGKYFVVPQILEEG
jgi:aspartyl-tRNA(Asn)/glutamyl-tRNA(Gln) amidotransferase subunit C